MARIFLAFALLFTPISLGGCVVGTVVEAAAETVEGAVEITGAAVDAAIPDGKKSEDKEGD